MTLKVITIRLTEKEQLKLKNLAFKKNKSISCCARDLMFSNTNNEAELVKTDLQEIKEKLNEVTRSQNEMFKMEKKILKLNVILSTSILQTRFLIANLFNPFRKIYHHLMPNDNYIFPEKKEKENFIHSELNKTQKELEQIH
jgi:hypothetical protein